MNDERLGQALLNQQVISQDQLDRARRLQANAQPRPPLAAVLASMGAVDEARIAKALAAEIGARIVDLEADPPDAGIKGMIPAALATRCRVVPHAAINGSVLCVAAAPIGPEDRARLEFVLNRPMELAIAPESAVNDCLQKLYGMSVESMIADLSRTQESGADAEEAPLHDLRELAQEPTLINLVNMIITAAYEDRASDIHIEPYESTLTIRYRVDGILHDVAPPPKQFQSAIVSRVKIMAGMDIAERYVPQDGQIRVNVHGQLVDIRVATVPTVYGESVVMRLLRKDESLIDLTNLGMSSQTLERFNKLLGLPHGILLSCGPTGSGKSTTLYAALLKIFTPAKKIITIEDPVEYKIQGINQIPVRPKRGLTFATGLRAIVRQDPDIIMVGEIRDRETADISIRSALTGHLVFSSLHTNDAAGAITRLLDMGIEPFLIASSLQGALGQRLVRRLCRHCRRPVAPDPLLARQFGVTALPESVWDAAHEGCDECHGHGYFGRIGVFELLTMNEQLHELVLHHASSAEVKRAAHNQMQSMRDDGWEKIKRGVTTTTEVLQATQYEGNGPES
jgi:type II secretory ATPase GspE/PulE/Tfp pilus assembly ATPase PilB-like protein